MRWLRKLLGLEPIYYPEVQFHGSIADTDWKNFREEVSKTYDTHPSFYKAIQILLKKEEAAATVPPLFKDGQDPSKMLAEWQENAKMHAYRADILRYILRLPIRAAAELKREQDKLEKKEESRKEEDI